MTLLSGKWLKYNQREDSPRKWQKSPLRQYGATGSPSGRFGGAMYTYLEKTIFGYCVIGYWPGSSCETRLTDFWATEEQAEAEYWHGCEPQTIH